MNERTRCINQMSVILLHVSKVECWPSRQAYTPFVVHRLTLTNPLATYRCCVTLSEAERICCTGSGVTVHNDLGAIRGRRTLTCSLEKSHAICAADTDCSGYLLWNNPTIEKNI